MGSQDLLFTSQELSSDDSMLSLLPSFDMSSDSTSLFLDTNVISNVGDGHVDDNLFDDSINPIDFSSFSSSPSGMDMGEGGGGFLSNDFELLEASCSSTNELQPLQLISKKTKTKKLRTRGDGACASQDQPPSSLDGFINTLGIFGDPAQREEELRGTSAASEKIGTEYYPCIPNIPNHLCCESQGVHIARAVFLVPTDIYATMSNCEPGTFEFILK